MRISALAELSGVPVATIKFYLREGILHSGARTSATQADYDETHVRRIALIRALIGPAGLSISAAKTLIGSLEAPPPEFHDLLGAAHSASPRVMGDVDEATEAEAIGIIERAGWTNCSGENRDALASALAGLRAADFTLKDETFDLYAAAMTTVADDEVRRIPTDSLQAAVEYVLLGTVLVEPVLLAMRRLAHERASARIFADRAAEE
ncbi:MerR family transcriptional regulator [Amnibacterium flavum]|uniref:MerR family transcriptional regulator n=1 Tax=Amnibacterium flavum TaxID=2173173 RepID=A0A2V1HSN2_9MICO|nr:MerR family transcriptional regulator [Amnibacterium flavum]PVZ94049.1 MerR family transcriptional regulator [Amnibacterium flavum]